MPFGWSQNKLLLVGGNVLLGVVLIALSNAHVLPLDGVNFTFFSFVLLLFSLYRPGWAFLIFVGVIPFENINLAPLAWGFDLRPYQWVALLLFVAVILRVIGRKLSFDLVRPRWFDWLLLVVPLGAFLGALYAPDPGAALKQAIVILSFGLVYAIGRIFWQSEEDVRQAIPFFLSSSLVVCGYALWQNVRFLEGLSSYQAMSGRPNATFSEADWLGMFVIVVLSLLWALVVKNTADFSSEQGESLPLLDMARAQMKRRAFWFFFVFQIFALIILLISVSRSAWLGAGAATLGMGLAILLSQGWGARSILLRQATFFFLSAGLAGMVAVIAVLSFHLTTFQLFSRAQSATSGLQKITVSCEREIKLPEKIESIEKLTELGCRHIRLEEIESEQLLGMFVGETKRDDPNVVIRKRIYAVTLGLIREHPLLGIGWGSAGAFLGTDERGAGLNASDMFLEIWLGSGIIGLVAFSLFWFSVIACTLYQFFRGAPSGRPLLSFVMALWFGIIVFNLFNSGILLGFFFLYLALGALILERPKTL